MPTCRALPFAMVVWLITVGAHADASGERPSAAASSCACAPLERGDVWAERQRIEQGLTDLRSARAELPIALPLVATLGSYALSYSLMLSAWMADPGQLSPGLLAASAVPLGLGITSNTWLVRRMRARTHNKNQLLALDAQLDALRIRQARAAAGGCPCTTQWDLAFEHLGAKLTQLRREEEAHEVAAPASMALLGLGFALACAPVAVVYGLLGTVYGDVSIPAYHHGLRGLAGIAAGGLLVGISGGVWFVVRQRARAAVRVELDALRLRRERLMPQFLPQISPHHVGLVLRWPRAG